MSQIRLYLDEDMIRRALIQALRNTDIDVVTTSEANNLSCTDEHSSSRYAMPVLKFIPFLCN